MKTDAGNPLRVAGAKRWHGSDEAEACASTLRHRGRLHQRRRRL